MKRRDERGEEQDTWDELRQDEPLAAQVSKGSGRTDGGAASGNAGRAGELVVALEMREKEVMNMT